MRRNLKYLLYLIRHKWFVLIAGLKIGVPVWLLIIHDWSKFLPSEWGPYSRTFYDERGRSRYDEDPDFSYAWNAHQKRNPHHWQFWILRYDCGDTLKLDMPRRYLKEMIADWMGAGRAIAGSWDIVNWYAKNSGKMELSAHTRIRVNTTIDALRLDMALSRKN